MELERMGVAGFGWGAAWLGSDGRIRTYRKPVRLAEDDTGREALKAERSHRFLVHLRRPSKLSTVQMADTQPFQDEQGAFAFCHNGYLKQAEDYRARFADRLHGRADSEIGFRYVQDLLGEGVRPGQALAATHRALGGRANFGYLGADGELLVDASNEINPMWTFSLEGAAVAASALHSDDESLFDLVFPEATNRSRLGAGQVVEVATEGTERDR
jgi:predicted glutamine amidotransferase